MTTLGDKTFEALGLKIEQSYQHRIAPGTRDYTLEIPGRHGKWDFGADMGPRDFLLPCQLHQADQAGLQAAINALNDHLFDATGRPKTMKLIFDYEPEKYYMVRYSGGLPVSRVIGIGRFSLPLTAFDPFSYAPSTAYDPTETYYYDTGLQYDAGLMYDNPEGFYWRYRKQYIGLYNYSGIETPVRITVTGSVINPRITNQTTGQKLTVSTVVDGELTSDTNQYYVRQTDAQKAGTYFLRAGFPAQFYEQVNEKYIIAGQYGDFAVLAPGKNSLMLEGGLPDARVNVEWLHKFV